MVERQHVLWWALAGVVAIAIAFRVLRPAERRSLSVTWVLVVLSTLALLVASTVKQLPLVAVNAVGAAWVFWGWALIHLGSNIVFRVVLPRVGLSVPRIAHDLTFTAIAIAWGLVCLRLSGVDPSQLFTTSAVITAVIAFSMQDTIGNVLGGVTLQLDNSLRVGDWVQMDSVSGRVTDVHWRYTAIETRDRELVIVPNGWLMKNRFTVLREPVDSPLAWRRSVRFNVSASADPDTVIRALERSVADAEIPNVLSDPPPNAILSEISFGYSRYTLRYWLSNPRFDDPSDSSVRVHALSALARAGVVLGVPQEERLLIKEDDSWRLSAGQRESDQRLNAIRQTELFAKLPEPEQRTLADRLIHAPFAAGDVMTRQGAVAHWLYLIIKGEAKVVVDGADGRLQVAVLRDGAIFGEMGMLTGEPRSATVVAATAVDCYRLDKAGFAKVLEQRPEIAKEMAAIVEARNSQRGVLLAAVGQSVVNNDDILGRMRKFFSLRG